MKAVRIRAQGGLEKLAVEEIAVPSPGPDQALVRVKAIGVNFIDVYQRTGQYSMSTPFTAGNEGAGVVEAVGDGVTEIRVGDRVAWCAHLGSYAEYALVPVWKLAPLPAALSFEQAAAIMEQGLTAHYLAHSTFPLKHGHRALVHAAAGGVGLLLVQIAKRLGATVYGTVGNQEKADLARQAGVEAAILYRDVDFAAEIRRLTDGQGVHVVYDSVGKDTFEGSLKSLSPRGYVISYGQSSGAVPPIDLGILASSGSVFISRPTLGHYLQNREELLTRARDIFAWVAEGQLAIRIDSTYPLAEASEAHRRIESRQSAGKILLTV